MDWTATTLTGEFHTSFPKVDLHRHLEGSLRPATIAEIIQTYRLPFPAEQVQALTQVTVHDVFSPVNFLSKFQVLRQLYRSPEIIQRVTREAVEDAAADQVRYLELRFTPAALSRVHDYPLDEVMDWVCASAQQAGQSAGLPVRLIASVNRHESVALAEKVLTLAAERQSQGLAGVDLAGNEAEFPAGLFLGVFQAARQAGLNVTLHAGEWGSAENIREAIEVFQADRIGHGVRVLESPAVSALAAERGIPFEVCLSSNIHSGIFPSRADHPFQRMLAAGINASLHSDDPSISGITLADEYLFALQDQKLTRSQLEQSVLSAAQAAFLPETEKQALLRRLRIELDLLEES